MTQPPKKAYHAAKRFPLFIDFTGDIREKKTRRSKSRCESKSWDDNKTVEREAFFFAQFRKFELVVEVCYSLLLMFFIRYVSITREASSLPTDLRVLEEKRKKEDFRPKFQS